MAVQLGPFGWDIGKGFARHGQSCFLLCSLFKGLCPDIRVLLPSKEGLEKGAQDGLEFREFSLFLHL